MQNVYFLYCFVFNYSSVGVILSANCMLWSLNTPVNDYPIIKLVDDYFNNWLITINPINCFSSSSCHITISLTQSTLVKLLPSLQFVYYVTRYSVLEDSLFMYYQHTLFHYWQVVCLILSLNSLSKTNQSRSYGPL